MYENDHSRKAEKHESYPIDSGKIKNIESIQLSWREAEQWEGKDTRKMVKTTIKIKKWGTEDNTQDDTQGWILWKMLQGKKEDYTTKKRWVTIQFREE